MPFGRHLVLACGCAVVLAVAAADVPGAAERPGFEVFEGTVTLVHPWRDVVVVQERGRARAVQLDPAPAPLRVGDRVAIEGRWQAVVRAFPDYPDRPTGSAVLPAFETTTAGADHYLARLRGWLVPPADGEYIFWIAGDDEVELWLGTDDSPGSLRRIAAATGSDPHAGQQSLPVVLKAGRRYAIEALHREWRGHDFVNVAWQGPGFDRCVIDGEHLRPGTGNAGRGILREYWTHCYITSLGVLFPEVATATMFSVGEARVRKLGEAELPAPRRIRVDRPWTEERNFLHVVVDGTVTFAAVDQGGLALELSEGEARMMVRILEWEGGPSASWLHRRVRVQGVCEIVRNASGEPTTGLLWAQDGARVERLSAADPSRQDPEVVPIFALEPTNLDLAWGQRVVVRGTVVEQDGEAGVLKLRGDDSFHGFISDQGSDWRSIGVPVPVAMGKTILVGLVTSSASAEDVVATFDGLRPTPGASRTARLGDTPEKGGVVIEDSGVTFRAGGGREWGGADTGHFLYQPMAGNGEIVARIRSFDTDRPSDKAGVMMRESLDADSPVVALVMTLGATRLDLLYRQTRGAILKPVDRLAVRAPQWLRLMRRENLLTVFPLDGDTLRLRGEVEIAGTLGWQDGGPVLLDAQGRGVRPPAGSEPGIVAAEPGPHDVRIADLPVDAADGRRFATHGFRIRGVVTFMDRVAGRDLLFVQDDSGGALIRTLPGFFDTRRLEAGQWIEGEGGMKFTPSDPPFGLVRAISSGPGKMPRPRPVPNRAEIAQAEGHWVEARGIVRRARDGRLYVMEQDGLLPAWIGGDVAPGELSSLVDALVTLRGVFTDQLPDGPMLLVPSTRFIEVRESAPGDPFAIPSNPVGHVRAWAASPQTSHRVKLTGVVNYREGNLLGVQDESGGARVVLESNPGVAVGDAVEVAGFPERSGTVLSLVEAVMRRTGPGRDPVPVPLTRDDMLAGRLDSVLVRLEGVVLDQKTRDGHQVLGLQSGPRALEATLPGPSGRLPTLLAGSRVEVTGFNQVRWAAGDRAGDWGGEPVSATIHLLLRSPADVVLLERPPWWSWQHTAGVMVALVLVLSGSLVWIRTLRRRVEERTHALRETMGRLQAETEVSATLAERDRLAAEIHDTLEQGLSGIMMQLDGLESRLTADPAGARQSLEMARRMVRFSRGEVRHSLWDLGSTLLQEGGLGAALAEIARQMSAGGAVPVQVEISGPPQALPPAIEHHLLRCAQEALTNALKHAHAAVVRIALRWGGDAVELEVSDDGCGFVPETVLAGRGENLGLRNLRSRSKKMKARLDISSRSGGGTTIRLTVSGLARGEVPDQVVR